MGQRQERHLWKIRKIHHTWWKDRLIHCASLGEFEQGRPLIEKLKAEGVRLNTRGLTTQKPVARSPKNTPDFLLPSGLWGPKTTPALIGCFIYRLMVHAMQGAFGNCKTFPGDLCQAYEFWYYYLKIIKYRNIPLLLVSALFAETCLFWNGMAVCNEKCFQGSTTYSSKMRPRRN